jgi:thioredoxin-related protein
MKFIFSLAFIFLLNSQNEWNSDFEQAKIEAARSHKLILLNFSGSDWCSPCIRLKEKIFDSDIFEKYAEQNLILVRADFPRLKKNQLSKEQTKQNEKLADQYDSGGKFPFTILLDETGKILKEWEGYPDESPEKFVLEVNAFAHAVI